MTTPNHQDQPPGRLKQFIIIAMLVLGFLFAVGTLLILVEAASPESQSASPTASPNTPAAPLATSPAQPAASTSPLNTPVSPLESPAAQFSSPSAPLATPSLPPGVVLSPTTPHINLPTVQYPTIPPSAPSYIVPIQSVASSGVTGTVLFQDVSGAVAILLHVDGLEDEVIVPVELLHGTCAVPGPLAYSLVSPDGGESETDLSINLNQFNAQKPYAVFIYRSAQDRTVIACGNIP